MAMITQNLDYVLSVGDVHLIPFFLTWQVIANNILSPIKTSFGRQQSRPTAQSKARSELMV